MFRASFMNALLGTKLGMTRIFDELGRAIPVTAIQAGPCVVTQLKTAAKDGYSAVQIGLGTKRHPNKPLQGHSKSLSAAPQFLREFLIEEGEEYAVGDSFQCDVFTIGDQLRLTAHSKGKGFAGVIKRHNFHRGPQSHGSDHHRAPGSIGSMFPQHVMKGHGMPGKMGNADVTVRKVKIVDIDLERNLIFVKGPVPGVPGGLVEMARM